MWAIRLVALLAIVAGACKEIPVDNSTANVIRRSRDTVITHDVKVVRDTTVKVDTIITLDRDTLYKRDTIINTRTIIQTDTVFSRDTVIQKDTIQIRDTVSHRDTITVRGDTLWLHDTLRLRDTIVTRDTVRHVDTLIKRDTITRVDTVRQVSPELPRFGTLFRKRDNDIVGSIPISIDDVTRLVVQLQGDAVVSIRLNMMARVTESYDTASWGVPPSWMYLTVTPKLELTGGKGRRELTVDPWNNTTGSGMAIVPRSPYNHQWIGTKPGAGGEFVVTEVDNGGRWIYAYVKSKFSELNATVDSLALKFRY